MLRGLVICCIALASVILPVYSQALSIYIAGVGEQKHAAQGVLLDEKGTLATVSVLGTDPRKVTMKDSNGEDVVLKLLAHDVVSRITLLEVPEGLRKGQQAVKMFGDSTLIEPATILSRGLHEGKSKSLMVSRDKRFNGRVLALSMIRVNHGEEGVVPGTPLFDSEGKLIALSHQGLVGEPTTTYALPVEVLKHIMSGETDAGDEYRLVKRCWVGISLEALNDAPIVTGVRPDSPARRAGIIKGDILLAIDGKRVAEYADVVNLFYYLQPNLPVVFKLLRGMEVKEFKVTPEVNPLLVE